MSYIKGEITKKELVNLSINIDDDPIIDFKSAIIILKIKTVLFIFIDHPRSRGKIRFQ